MVRFSGGKRATLRARGRASCSIFGFLIGFIAGFLNFFLVSELLFSSSWQHLDNVLANAPTNDTELPSFGMELEYTFPESSADMEESERLKQVGGMLSLAGITNEIYTDKWESKVAAFAKKRTWKVVSEHDGFELVSPIGPSLETVERIIGVMNVLEASVHSSESQMHVCVDARDRSLYEVRNVFKNFAALEHAFDEIRYYAFRTDSSIKTVSIGRQYVSLKSLYRQLDSCHSIRCCKSVAQPKPNPWIYIMNLRKVNNNVTASLVDEYTGESVLVPSHFEFRGQPSTLDREFAVAWIQLVRTFIQRTFSGVVLPPIERTVDEAWLALFHDLIRDEDLHRYFDTYRKIIRDAEKDLVGARSQGRIL